MGTETSAAAITSEKWYSTSLNVEKVNMFVLSILRHYRYVLGTIFSSHFFVLWNNVRYAIGLTWNLLLIHKIMLKFYSCMYIAC